MIELSKLRLEPARQARVELNQDTVDEYADAMRAGSKFPPVEVYFDGEHFWLADGLHRCEAAKAAGLTEIFEERHPGTQRDAILYSLSANARHGLRRSNADKRRSVQTILDDPEWAQWSSREIARICAVSHEFVSQLRESYLSTLTDSQPSTRTVQRSGTTYALDVSNIGKRTSQSWLPTGDTVATVYFPYDDAGIEGLIVQQANDHPGFYFMAHIFGDGWQHLSKPIAGHFAAEAIGFLLGNELHGNPESFAWHYDQSAVPDVIRGILAPEQIAGREGGAS